MKKKIELIRKLIEKNSDLFICPVCGKGMKTNKTNSLYCAVGHNFDLSGHGYVNMLLKQVKSDYDKQMFESRKLISKSGFFDPMLSTINDLILEENSDNGLSRGRILDAGCGEGSYFVRILTCLENNRNDDLLGIGIDISKEAIRAASKESIKVIWCVADLSKIPIKNDRFDIVINILSPANYSEFGRVLNNRGLLIKVVPGSEYLIELRDVLFKGTQKQLYSNNRVIQHFSNNFSVINKLQIRYNMCLDNRNIEHLIKMTPLAWNAEKDKIEEILEIGIEKITVDFEVVVGKKT